MIHQAWLIPFLETGWIAYLSTTDAVCYHDGHRSLDAYKSGPIHEVPIHSDDAALRDEGTIRVTDSRRRARRLTVAEANDALTTLAVPPQWKGAIRGALPAGIYIANASIIGNGVKVTMRVPSEDVAVSMIRGIARSNAFTNISVPSQPRREGTAWILDLIFDFPAGR